jgi:hypothetical protein
MKQKNKTQAGNIAPQHVPTFELRITLNAITDCAGNNEVNLDELHITTCDCVDAGLVLDFADWINNYLPLEIVTSYIDNNWHEKGEMLNIIRNRTQFKNN